VEQDYLELPESATHIDDPYSASEKKKRFGSATT
jgi:hypothetical protein